MNIYKTIPEIKVWLNLEKWIFYLIPVKKEKKNVNLFFFLNDLLDRVVNTLTVSTICYIYSKQLFNSTFVRVRWNFMIWYELWSSYFGLDRKMAFNMAYIILN